MNKMVIGIDVSKYDLDVAFRQNNEHFFLGKYPNSQSGFQSIYQDIETKRQKANADTVHVVMEPTGGYEQGFAYFAFQKGWEVSLVNPFNVRSWYKGIGKRSKTDKQDAIMLAHFGAVQNPPLWRPLPDEIAKLESMINRLDDLKEMLHCEKNRLEAQEKKPVKDELVKKSIQDNISHFEEQIEELEKAIGDYFETHPEAKEKVKQLKAIPGIGKELSKYLFAGLWRFNVLTGGKGTSKAITAYYGLDPQHNESGVSVYKRPSISRQGDHNMRRLLYMGALGGIRGNNPLQAFYRRLIGSGKKAKVAIVACARKILVWSWAVFKQNCSFDFSRFGYGS